MGDPHQDPEWFDRRTVIGTLGSLATVPVAGCNIGDDDSNGGDDGDGDNGDGGGGSGGNSSSDGGDSSGDGGGSSSDGGGSGSSGDGGGGDGNGGGGDGSGETTLYFWNWHTSESASRTIDDQVSEFEDETGVTVEQVVHDPDSYETTVRNAVGSEADTAPDVYQIDVGPGRMGPFVENEHTLPVEDHFDEEFFERFLAVSRDQVRYRDRDVSTWGDPDGRMHGVPSRVASVNMFYNKTVLDDAGVDPDSLERRMDVTWEEFLDICSQVRDAGYDPIVAGNRNRWVIGHYI